MFFMQTYIRRNYHLYWSLGLTTGHFFGSCAFGRIIPIDCLGKSTDTSVDIGHTSARIMEELLRGECVSPEDGGWRVEIRWILKKKKKTL